MRSRTSAAILVLGALLIAITSAQPAAAGSFHGVAAESASLIAKDFERMGRANSRSLRVSVVWKRVEESPGERDFTQLDALFEMAAANGVRVLPALVGPAPTG